MAVLNNVTTQDDYTEENTLVVDNATRVTLQVFNAAIYWQITDGDSLGNPSGAPWKDEEFLAPSYGSFARNCHRVRVRSAVAGQPAQVTVSAS